MERSDVSLPKALISGLCMGTADAVPGVSGGTIALVIGIYDEFIGAISTMISTPKLIRTTEGRGTIVEALKLLVPLGIGLLAGYILVVKLLVGKTEAPGILLQKETAPVCFGFLFGLVLASIPEPLRRIQKWKVSHFVAFAIAAGSAAWFVGLPHLQSEPEKWMLVLGGAGAISVMLLPGVSGSLLLVILGQYAVVGQAVTERNVPVLLTVVGGIVLGVITFVPLLKKLLHSAEAVTMAALAGLMAGSLRALWPYKDFYNPKVGPLSNNGNVHSLHWVVLAALIGVMTVFLLRLLGRGKTKTPHT